MSELERLREKMIKNIELYGLESTEALKASQELDVEISKEQLKISMSQSEERTMKMDHINVFKGGIKFVTLETCMDLLDIGIETTVSGNDVLFITKSEEDRYVTSC